MLDRNRPVDAEIEGSAPANKPKGLRFEGLDALRGIGAPLVVYAHYTSEFWPYGENYLLHTSIYLLVDVFFLLSGFVLAHAFYDRANFNIWEFTKKRIFRLWPVHMLTLVVMSVLLVLVGDHVFKSGFLLNALMLHNVGLSERYLVWINFPSWSISVEFVTNLLVAVLVLAIPNKRWNSIALTALCVTSATILFFTVDNLGVFTENLFGGLNTGLLRGTVTILLGILAYRFFIANRSWFERTSLLRTVIFGVLLAAFFVTLFVPGKSIETDLLYLAIYTMLILALANPGPFWMPMLLRFRFLASISFSLYMVHMIVIRFMFEVPFWPRDFFVGLGIALLISIVLAALIHYKVERPAYDWLVRRWSNPSPGTSLPARVARYLTPTNAPSHDDLGETKADKAKTK